MATISTHPGAIGEIALGEFLSAIGADTGITIDDLVTAIFDNEIVAGVTFKQAIAAIYAESISANVVTASLTPFFENLDLKPSLAEIEAATLIANVKYVNNEAIIGTGTEDDPWGPVV